MRPTLHHIFIAMIAILLLSACTSTGPATGGGTYATPVAAPPYPTMTADRWTGGSGNQHTLTLPGVMYDVRLAVHPTQGWPAIAVKQRYSESSDPIKTFIQAYDPIGKRWNPAIQVDLGASSNGMDAFGSAQVAITNNNEIIAVWGGSDASGGTETIVWTSSSMDYGLTWSTPIPIGQKCRLANDMAASPDGQIVVAMGCYTGSVGSPGTEVIGVAIRTAAGAWHQESLSVPSWYGAAASVVITGDGPTAAASILSSGDLEHTSRVTVYVSHKQLSGGSWSSAGRVTPAVPGFTDLLVHYISGVGYHRPNAAGQADGVTFVFSALTPEGQPVAFSLISSDAGQSWGYAGLVVAAPEGPTSFITGISPAYDPAADRLVAVWDCCGNAMKYVPSTHYAHWMDSGTGIWFTGTPLTPVVTGSTMAGRTRLAQAENSRQAWIAYIEKRNTIVLRTLDLNQIIPVEYYQ